jgi:ribosome biogenesis GTPase
MSTVDWRLVATVAAERHGSLPPEFLSPDYQPQPDVPLPGRIISRVGPVFRVATPNGLAEATLSGRLSHQNREGTTPPLAVGDYVELSPDGVRVDSLLPRATSLTRKEVGQRAHPQTLAANVDLALLITTVPAERDYSIRRIERLLATLDPEVELVVVLNKSDLWDDPEAAVRATTAQLPETGVVAVSAKTGAGMDELLSRFPERSTIVLAGSSGTGKSTLISRLTGENLQSGEVRGSDQRGRHTTTVRSSHALVGDRIIIDMPGIREIQLWATEEQDEQLASAFPEIMELAADCRFSDCSHAGEPGCAVRAAVQSQDIPQERYLSFLELREELEAGADRAQKEGRLHERRKARKARMARRSRGGGR